MITQTKTVSTLNPILIHQEYQLEENEERSMIEPRSFENPKFKELIKVLIDWVNDELHHYRIIVQDIEEDLYDGQVEGIVSSCLPANEPFSLN